MTQPSPVCRGISPTSSVTPEPDSQILTQQFLLASPPSPLWSLGVNTKRAVAGQKLPPWECTKVRRRRAWVWVHKRSVWEGRREEGSRRKWKTEWGHEKERGSLGQRKITRDKKLEVSSSWLIPYCTNSVQTIRDAGKHCYEAGRILISLHI